MNDRDRTPDDVRADIQAEVALRDGFDRSHQAGRNAAARSERRLEQLHDLLERTERAYREAAAAREADRERQAQRLEAAREVHLTRWLDAGGLESEFAKRWPQIKAELIEAESNPRNHPRLMRARM
ncbi:MAG: hypothetical protein GEU80_09210 [Dehalococcoidia bacterium]|nr:hypothetical protein [Dehalococcoidia bacterium]